MSSDQAQHRAAIVVALAALAMVNIWQIIKRRRKAIQERRRGSYPVEGAEFLPPLPDEVVALLQTTRLCHLSTTAGNGIPHLSLMNFTYDPSEERIIMATRRDTRKYELLESSPKVAVLIHDFPPDGEQEDDGRTYSITLNGSARVESGDEAERYRSIHLANNPDYKQFIVGANTAVFTVAVESARICNLQDRVTVWEHKAVRR